MKFKTLFCCPVDQGQVLFEEVFDERKDFFYQAMEELPRVCPMCGRAFAKGECLVVEELFGADIARRPPDMAKDSIS